MSQKEDEILNREFVRVITLGGLAGNLMSGGTGIGAILQIPLSKGLSKMLPNVISESVLEIHAAPAAVLKAAIAILEHAGRIVAESPSDNAAITAIVMSGFLKANPVLIQLKIQHVGDISTRVVIRGMAKKALIKLRAEEKAVNPVVTSLTQAFPGQGGKV